MTLIDKQNNKMYHNRQDMHQHSSSSTECDIVRLTKRTKSQHQWTQPIIRYPAISWPRDQMQAVDIKTVNLLTMHEGFHHKSSTKRLCQPEKSSLVCQCCHPQWNKAFIVSFNSSLNTMLLIQLPTWIVCTEISSLTTGKNSRGILFHEST